MSQYPFRSAKEFAQLLAKFSIIDPVAVEEPEFYDEGQTMRQIKKALEFALKCQQEDERVEIRRTQ